MKKLLLLLSLAVLSSTAFADDGDDDAIKECMRKWKNHPFNAKQLDYRTISTKVKVLGVGGDVNDSDKTSSPELILVKPGVSVMSKTVYRLENPNGWYCMKGRVSVLGKIEIDLHCKANLASSQDDLSILGASDNKSGGTSVLGSVRINRQCK